MTTLFLIRHSVRMPGSDIASRNVSEDKIVTSEKIILSIEGEERAKILSEKKELQDVDVIYTSNCVRTLQTAKYLMNRLSLPAHIDERLDERRIGIPNDDIYPDWLERQYFDSSFHTEGGESQIDVQNRMDEVVSEILDQYQDKKIAIFSHGYAITFYLLKFCKLVNVVGGHLTYEFHNKIIYDQAINAPEVFQLVFDGKKFLSIECIQYNDLPYMHGV